MPLKFDTGETAGMIVVSDRLGRLGPLARYIATKRTPGDGWLSYEDIAAEIERLTRAADKRRRVKVTRAGVENWARIYGIPMTKRDATDQERAEYLAAVDKHLRAR